MWPQKEKQETDPKNHAIGMLLEIGYTAVLMLAALLIAFIATGGRP